MNDPLILFDLYTMHLIILVALWVTIFLFYWQYRACHKAQKGEEGLKLQNEELSCFVYGAAHDLKAPLRAIGQIAQRLDKDLQGALSTDQKEDMILLRKRVQRGERLVDDLLEYWQAGKSWIKPYSPMTDGLTLAQDCVEMVAPPPAFHISLDPLLEKIRVFQLPLQQVLVNLIDNAIKHHDKEVGTITVRLQDEWSFYRFTVSDDGPGIPEGSRETIFETFETLKSRDEVEGSGLGLSLVKRIVIRQGGAVHAENNPGRGTSFIFTWPKKQIF